MPKSIQVRIPRKGLSKGLVKPEVEANGFTGNSCTTATQGYLNALGSMQEEEVKPEMYETEQGVERIDQGGLN